MKFNKRHIIFIFLICFLIFYFILNREGLLAELSLSSALIVILVDIIRGLFLRTDYKRIVVRAKKFNWVFFILSLSLGLFLVLDYVEPNTKMLFEFVPENVSFGILFILFGISVFQYRILIDHNFIKLENSFLPDIDNSKTVEYRITENVFELKTKEYKFLFKIYTIPKNIVVRITKIIKEKMNC